MGGFFGGLLVLLGLGAVVAFFLIGIYNRLVKLRVTTEDGWASIDVQLKRRYDLIPNLVETVKAYAKHERETFENVVKARQAGIDAKGVKEQAQAENMITGALRQLFALSEAYPDLKANQNFLALQEELTATEGRVAYARQFYNDSVLDYNNKIQQFPALLFAKTLNFTERDYFEAEPDARSVPTVEF